MRATRLIELSDAERFELVAVGKQTPHAREHRRIEALLKLDDGEPPELVADALGVSRATVYRWITRYTNERRVDDLLDGSRSGRPSALRGIDPEQIEQLLADSPEHYGYRSTIWTAALLGGHLQREFGISVSPETLRRHLRRQHYQWKRPRYAYKTPDPHVGQKKGASFQH